MASKRSTRVASRVVLLGGVMALVLGMSANAFAAVPITQVSSDPYTNTTSYHQTQLEPDTFSFGATTVGTFQTGRFPDGGASNICWATTTNNGHAWATGCLPDTTVYATPAGPWARVSDPSVAYDPQDGVWMISSLAIDNNGTGKAVLMSRSTDGGLTWQNPVTVSTGGGSSFYDKEWVTCDTWSASPNYGNCYAEWDDANLGNKLLMSRSTDGGLTWALSTAPSSAVIGGQPLVQPNGTVIVPISNAFGTSVETFISTNGGVSYTGPNTATSIQVHGAPGIRDGAGLVSAEVDGGGTIYIAWSDCRFHSGCTADDIVMTTTTNGTTFTPVVKIPTGGTGTPEFFLPGIGANHSTSGGSAHLGVTYYATQNATCNSSTCKIGASFVSSANGGATWSAPKRIEANIKETWLPQAGGFFMGDYISTSFGSNGRAYPVIANATFTGISCGLGNITACNEFMVSPTNGLATAGGAIPVGREAPVGLGHGHGVPGKMLTAY